MTGEVAGRENVRANGSLGLGRTRTLLDISRHSRPNWSPPIDTCVADFHYLSHHTFFGSRAEQKAADRTLDPGDSVSEVFANQQAFDAYVSARHTVDFRNDIQPFIGAPYDERLYQFANR